jgi:hypothetical protein
MTGEVDHGPIGAVGLGREGLQSIDQSLAVEIASDGDVETIGLARTGDRLASLTGSSIGTVANHQGNPAAGNDGPGLRAGSSRGSGSEPLLEYASRCWG